MLKCSEEYTESRLREIVGRLAGTRLPNAFMDLVEKLRCSSKQYRLSIVRGVPKIAIVNLDNMPDDRWKFRKDGKKPQVSIPIGCDGFVMINEDVRYVDFETKKKRVNVDCIIFHELSEVYYRVDGCMTYRDAHASAIGDEMVLMRQFPGITEYPAGGYLVRA